MLLAVTYPNSSLVCQSIIEVWCLCVKYGMCEMVQSSGDLLTKLSAVQQMVEMHERHVKIIQNLFFLNHFYAALHLRNSEWCTGMAGIH